MGDLLRPLKTARGKLNDALLGCAGPLPTFNAGLCTEPVGDDGKLNQSYELGVAYMSHKCWLQVALTLLEPE